MGILILYIFLVSIWHSILFFGYDIALNLILFEVPLLGIIYYALKKSNKINNKYGLLFMIPIILIGSTYFIYDDFTFKILNGMVSILLFALLFIYTVKPTYNLSFIIKDIFAIFSEPLNVIGKFYHEIDFIKLPKIDEKTKNKFIGIIIVIPIVIVVLLLLSSADMMFGRIFNGFFDIFKNIKLDIDDSIYRVIIIFILFSYIGSLIYFLMHNYEDLGLAAPESKKMDNFTIKLLLTVLNAIYVLFDIIQIRSLIFHQVASGIKYAEYAREGFFQLMFISLINLSIILISKKVKEKDNKYINVSSLIMIGLTLIIIISSFLRMNLYEAAYGYTLLRLLVYVTLITEVILLIPTIIYILKDKFNIVKYYMIILVTVYTILALTPVNYIIAKRNINRFYHHKELDIEYLEDYSYDNITLLTDLYNDIDNVEFKHDLYEYLWTMKKDAKIKGFQEFNIMRNKGRHITLNKE